VVTTTPELEDPASADGREAPAPPEFAAAQHFHGRVIRLVSLDRAMTTIGASAGGLLAAGIGAQSTQFIYGALTLVAGTAVLVLARGLRDYRMP